MVVYQIHVLSEDLPHPDTVVEYPLKLSAAAVYGGSTTGWIFSKIKYVYDECIELYKNTNNF